MTFPHRAPLPVDDLHDRLVEALQSAGRLLIAAPTGSGKSTRLPQFLIEPGVLPAGRVIVLQPRRMAARLLAQRVAEERGTPLGDEIGYRIRQDQMISSRTRLEYVTEGILVRQILHDPSLRGVSAVLLDEFHERSLAADSCLALLLKAQQERRPDLRIVILSATLDLASLQSRLEPCPILEAGGRLFPLEYHYRKPPAGRLGPDYPAAAARLAREIGQTQPEGHILIFMPGRFEINRTLRALEEEGLGRQFTLFPLSGDLPPDAQDKAVRWNNGRKIIVATNVAETSLTIDGVRAVIDSGLARVNRFDPRRGLNALHVEKISQASATQRAGRAGRTGPGLVYRLWDEAETHHRPIQTDPEIKRVDLSELRLSLAAAPAWANQELPWLEPPPSTAWERARLLLEDLGAFHQGQITELGRTMAGFPIHPRLSRLFVAASREYPFDLAEVTLLAALFQGPPVILNLVDSRKEKQRAEMLASPFPSDFAQLRQAYLVAAQKNFDPAFCREWGLHRQNLLLAGDLARQFLSQAEQAGLDLQTGQLQPDNLRRILLLGFADQVARRLDRGTHRCALVHDRRGEIGPRSTVPDSEFIVAAEIEEGTLRGQVMLKLGMITAIEAEWLKEMDPEGFSEVGEVLINPDQRRAVRRTGRTWRGLPLGEIKEVDAQPDEASALWAEEVLAGRAVVKQWDSSVEQWIHRVNFCARVYPDYGFSEIDAEGRRILLEQFIDGALTYREFKDRPVFPTLRSWLSAEALGALDTLAPESMNLPGRPRPFRLDYSGENPPLLQATVQELYDAPVPLVVGPAKCPITVAVLAPNRRPVQITRDLGAFWTGSYPEVKKQLKGRYPKHQWR